MAQQVKDVVCEMMVDPDTAAAKTAHKGEAYYFCSPGCRAAFEKDPERYLQQEGTGTHQDQQGHHTHHAHHH